MLFRGAVSKLACPAVSGSAVFVPLAVVLLLTKLNAQLPLNGTPPSSSPMSKSLSGAPSAAPVPAGTQFLFDLESKFEKDTAAGGGKAFGSYFADDAVTLNENEMPVVGREAIAKATAWAPGDFQLTWHPVGGQMSPSGDMGFTWGYWEGRSKDKAGNPVVQKGRYMTVWKKQADGSWKVEMDSSNTEPSPAADCCKVP